MREQKQAGYDLLKILGGMPPAVYHRIMRTTQALKIDVAGHVPGEVGVRGALEARQRSIDHLDQYIAALNLTPDTSGEEEARRITALAQLTAKSGVWNVPTMYLWDLFHNAETGDAHRELKLMVDELGYTPYEALESGTHKVAQYFGTATDTGTVAQGKRADLILLNGNPLTDIAARAAGM